MNYKVTKDNIPNKSFAYDIIGIKLVNFWNDHQAWSQEIFGKDSELGPIPALYHLSEEVRETIDNPEDRMEWGDMFILLLDAWRRNGGTLEDLIDAGNEKLQICKTRKWGEPDGNGVRKHIKEYET
jgi:hypothetical protein